MTTETIRIPVSEEDFTSLSDEFVEGMIGGSIGSACADPEGNVFLSFSQQIEDDDDYLWTAYCLENGLC